MGFGFPVLGFMVEGFGLRISGFGWRVVSFRRGLIGGSGFGSLNPKLMFWDAPGV